MTKIRWAILIIWVVILAALIYVYFFQPNIFNKMFQYQGPGSPFVNTPYSAFYIKHANLMDDLLAMQDDENHLLDHVSCRFFP